MDKPYVPSTALRASEAPVTVQQTTNPAPMPSFEQAKAANEQKAETMTNPEQEQEEQESPVESVSTSGQGGLADDSTEAQPAPSQSDTPSDE